MGCDIHLFVEKYDDNSSEWVKIEKGFDDGYDNNGDCPYSGRNYILFSYLADVRNNVGIEPFMEIRGLPSNVSEEIKEESDMWGYDGHSHSYYTLKELKDAMQLAKTITYKDKGTVDCIEYLIFKANKKPTSFSGGVFGGSVKNISNEEMDKLISRYNILSKNNFIEDVIRHTYTDIEWEDNLFNSTKTFFESVIPQLENIGVDDNDIRIVFWFDN